MNSSSPLEFLHDFIKSRLHYSNLFFFKIFCYSIFQEQIFANKGAFTCRPDETHPRAKFHPGVVMFVIHMFVSIRGECHPEVSDFVPG